MSAAVIKRKYAMKISARKTIVRKREGGKGQQKEKREARREKMERNRKRETENEREREMERGTQKKNGHG